MISFKLKILLIFLLLTNLLKAEIVEKIEINGNKRVSDETIIVLGNIKKNENFTSAELNSTLKKLYDTNFFTNINISFDNNLLRIDVIENPIIEDIEITGIKKNPSLMLFLIK